MKSWHGDDQVVQKHHHQRRKREFVTPFSGGAIKTCSSRLEGVVKSSCDGCLHKLAPPDMLLPCDGDRCDCFIIGIVTIMAIGFV